ASTAVYTAFAPNRCNGSGASELDRCVRRPQPQWWLNRTSGKTSSFKSDQQPIYQSNLCAPTACGFHRGDAALCDAKARCLVGARVSADSVAPLRRRATKPLLVQGARQCRCADRRRTADMRSAVALCFSPVKTDPDRSYRDRPIAYDGGA